jgi:acyl-CoA thioesterase-1
MLRGIAPEDSYSNIESILKIGRQRGLRLMIIGVRAPGNFGPTYKTKFNAIFPKLAKTYDAEYVEHFFESLIDPTEPNQPLLRYFQNDRMHPNKQGVSKVVQTIGPVVQKLISGY